MQKMMVYVPSSPAGSQIYNFRIGHQFQIKLMQMLHSNPGHKLNSTEMKIFVRKNLVCAKFRNESNYIYEFITLRKIRSCLKDDY